MTVPTIIGMCSGSPRKTKDSIATAGGGTLILSPRNGRVAGAALVSGTVPSMNIVWNCNSVGSTKAGSKGTLQDKYAPANCRS